MQPYHRVWPGTRTIVIGSPHGVNNTVISERLDSTVEKLTVSDFNNKGKRTSSPKPFAFVKTLDLYHNGRLTQIAALDTDEPYLSLSVDGSFGWPVLGRPDMQDYGSLAYEQALGELFEKLRGSIDLSVDLFQAGQTAKMLKTVTDTVRFVKNYPKHLLLNRLGPLARQRRADPTAAVKGLGSKWLEFQYGWKPLAQTIYDTAERLLTYDVPSLMVIEGKGKEVLRLSYKGTPNGYPEVSAGEFSRRCLIKARFRPGDSVAEELGHFTSLNPASIAWELTPWSFVVDWFVDIGSYIRNYETAITYRNRFVDGFVTYSSKAEMSGTVASQSYGPSMQTIVGTTGYFRGSSMARHLIHSMPLPNAPTFKADLGSGRLLNAAALLSQFLGKK